MLGSPDSEMPSKTELEAQGHINRAVRKVPSDFGVQKEQGGQSNCVWVPLLVPKMLFLEMALDGCMDGLQMPKEVLHGRGAKSS